jgi:glutaredoxin-like protein
MSEGRLIVYWRPGCGSCMRLERALDRAGIEYEQHDIWREPEAAEFVRTHNNGNETVPTVVLDGTVYSNPDPVFVLERMLG